MIAGDDPFIATMQNNETVKDAQVEAEDALPKFHRLLASLYVHDCALPKLDTLLKTISDALPREHYKGVMSLVHLFIMLVNESPRLAKIADASETFASETLIDLFGPGEYFQNSKSPMEMLVTYVIEQNEVMSHESMIHMTDYLHGVILYNDIRAKRVQEVCELIMRVDDYYFDTAHASNGSMLSFLRSSCEHCMREDEFVGSVYDCFSKMERKKWLQRENTDDANQKNITNELVDLLIKTVIIPNAFESLFNAEDNKSQPCAKDDEENESQPCAKDAEDNESQPCGKDAEGSDFTTL